ncbi:MULTISPECIES: hypothetical protein [unclassified Streptomyces]|uniref:hypothetical protein n=1 Tax=unclassified Streptomyces TaxID=2593676 RepID=UPI002DDBFA90|nr:MULTISPECIES: hypothetical protein [unclassified Streptomyces]WSA95352.1 hypothetical protein OIE63_30180 [Streptomyces sp. NBC_01795]WSB79770.1 hypothetical protein OHB04_31290 [Streptomyces sp. NBC_01775]WSS12023.1 hypothetical protein OG533_08920 [Streptomyces sp. NBC_01186]WSS40737.1 hypothetical protein OG220_09080 [Streptomyces sp. NBC_01187]
MAKNKSKRDKQRQDRSAEEQTQQREQGKGSTADQRIASPADVARKGRERRFGHN